MRAVFSLNPTGKSDGVEYNVSPMPLPSGGGANLVLPIQPVGTPLYVANIKIEPGGVEPPIILPLPELPEPYVGIDIGNTGDVWNNLECAVTSGYNQTQLTRDIEIFVNGQTVYIDKDSINVNGFLPLNADVTFFANLSSIAPTLPGRYPAEISCWYRRKDGTICNQRNVSTLQMGSGGFWTITTSLDWITESNDGVTQVYRADFSTTVKTWNGVNIWRLSVADEFGTPTITSRTWGYEYRYTVQRAAIDYTYGYRTHAIIEANRYGSTWDSKVQYRYLTPS